MQFGVLQCQPLHAEVTEIDLYPRIVTPTLGIDDDAETKPGMFDTLPDAPSRALGHGAAPRKLLLHKSEIRKLFGLASVKGNALVPLSFYWKNGNVKVALAACKGKVQYDKRQDMKKRDADRELKRATMRRLKGR